MREQWGWTGLGFPSVGVMEGVRWAGPARWPAGLRPSVGGGSFVLFFVVLFLFIPLLFIYFLFYFISSFLLLLVL